MFDKTEIIYSYGVEEAISDGVFVDVTEKVNGIIKWQTVMSETLMNKIISLNREDEGQNCIIKDVASMFVLAVRGIIPFENDGKNLKFFVSLKADLSKGSAKIVSVINITSTGKPVMTFCLEEDL